MNTKNIYFPSLIFMACTNATLHIVVAMSIQLIPIATQSAALQKIWVSSNSTFDGWQIGLMLLTTIVCIEWLITVGTGVLYVVIAHREITFSKIEGALGGGLTVALANVIATLFSTLLTVVSFRNETTIANIITLIPSLFFSLVFSLPFTIFGGLLWGGIGGGIATYFYSPIKPINEETIIES